VTMAGSGPWCTPRSTAPMPCSSPTAACSTARSPPRPRVNSSSSCIRRRSATKCAASAAVALLPHGVKTFTIFGLPVPHVQFLVLPNDLGNGERHPGQNVFRISDVEYDLANASYGCAPARLQERRARLLAKGMDKPVSEIDIEFGTPLNPHTKGVAYVNGVKIHVIFDTGASTSYLTLVAAKRAGVTPESPGVWTRDRERDRPSRRRSWIAPFASFKVGDEEVATHACASAKATSSRDMLVGRTSSCHTGSTSPTAAQAVLHLQRRPVFNLTAARLRRRPSEAAATPAVEAPAAGAAPRTTRCRGAGAPRCRLRRAHDYEHALTD